MQINYVISPIKIISVVWLYGLLHATTHAQTNGLALSAAAIACRQYRMSFLSVSYRLNDAKTWNTKNVSHISAYQILYYVGPEFAKTLGIAVRNLIDDPSPGKDNDESNNQKYFHNP